LGIYAEDDDVEVVFREWTYDALTQIVRVDLFPQSPALVGPCAAFLRDRGQELRPGSRKNLRRFLSYFSRFLECYGACYGVRISEFSDITSKLFEDFLDWLWGEGDVVPRVNTTDGLEYISAAPIYNLAKSLVEFVKSSQDFGHLLPQIVEFDPNPARRGYRRVKHVSGLPVAHLASIRRACFTELEVTFATLETGRGFLENDQIFIPDLQSPAVDFKELGVCVKAYHHVESLGLPIPEVERLYPGLRRACNGQPYPNLDTVLRHLHFTRRSIVPVVLLLQMHFSNEPDTHLNLDWSLEEDSLLYGHRRGKLTGEKYRGGYSRKPKPYVRGDKRRFSPGHLIEMLRQITPGTAEHIPGCTRIFCFALRHGKFSIFSDSGNFGKVLKEFIKEHKLKKFTLSNLRKTGSDIVAKVSGGDVAEQKKWLLHETVATTIRSYQSPSAVSGREEQLAHSQNVRLRRLKTEGKIETRDASLPLGQRLAATVGFYCLDPYASPLRDQSDGALCTAFGRCPTCPLAQVDRASVRDCARLSQLRSGLISARSSVDPARWRSWWAPIFDALDNIWLPSFSPEIKEEAAKLVMPPIPGIE
jgi:hypothetical protein